MHEPVLDAVQAEILDAVLAVLLPSTSGPGATEARAGDYVRGRLAGPDQRWLDPLAHWLPTAAGREADAVAELAAAGTGDPGGELFARLRSWAWEGYLCDPLRGGNRDGVGWACFGWSPPDGRRAR
jgi:hypothetical protein